VAGDWRRLRSEELHNLYASSDIIGVIKSTSTRWAGYVARIENIKMDTKFWSGNLKVTPQRG
jgi:hypothetical protein